MPAPKELAVPAADAKIGQKIDYIAKRLAQALPGFKRQSRTLVREQGEGVQRCWLMVNLQGDKWNAGSHGGFYVNLAVQFPAVGHLMALFPGHEWRQPLAEQPDVDNAQLHRRLGKWLPNGHALVQDEYKIKAETDLAALANALQGALECFALPQLESKASLEAFRDEGAGDETFFSKFERIAAALVLQDFNGVQSLLKAQEADWHRMSSQMLEGLRHWLAENGVDTASLPTEAAPPRPSATDQFFAKREANERARNEAALSQLEAQMHATGVTPELLASSWLVEWQARRQEDPKTLADLRNGARIAALPDVEREAVLCAALQALAVAPPYDAVERTLRAAPDTPIDEVVAQLLKVLLPELGPLQRPETLFEPLLQLQARLTQDVVTASYSWGFAMLASWLERQPRSAALVLGVRAWLEQLSITILASHDAMTASLEAYVNTPLDPNDLHYEAKRETRELMLQQPVLSAEDQEKVRHRIAAYPEQSLAPADKAAVRSWRRWLRRDPATGLLPVQFEPDDFGDPAQQAWDAADVALQAAAKPLIQAWLDGVPTAKPTARWLKEFRAQIAAFDPAALDGWRRWVRERLLAFPQHSGRTEWATTGPRPGVGARLGECSEHLLLGLLWWSALDAGFADPPWKAVATAAFERLPEVGARAVGVGGLALRLVAGQSEEGAAWVAAQAKTKGAKQLAKAAEKALDQPFRA